MGITAFLQCFDWQLLLLLLFIARGALPIRKHIVIVCVFVFWFQFEYCTSFILLDEILEHTDNIYPCGLLDLQAIFRKENTDYIHSSCIF